MSLTPPKLLSYHHNVQHILVSHPYDNPIWDQTNPCDVLVDTINITEDLAGAYFTDKNYDKLMDQEYDNLR